MLNKLDALAALPKLTDWEITFLNDLIERKKTREDFKLSDKQTAILEKIEKEKTPKV